MLILASCNINIIYYKIEQELLSHFNQEQITERFNIYTNLILNENEKNEKKKLNLEKNETIVTRKKTRKKIKERMNKYVEFTTYKKKECI